MWMPNSQWIEDSKDARDYLESLGMTKWDVEDFCEVLLKSSDAVDWKEESKAWERDSAEQFEKRNGLINELQEVINDLRNGKGTKAKIADRIEKLCEYWY